MKEFKSESSNKNLSFESLDILIQRWHDGTFMEIIDDWKRIFSYSKRHKNVIIFCVISGLINTSLSLVSSVASKYMIDIITGYKTRELWVLRQQLLSGRILIKLK